MTGRFKPEAGGPPNTILVAGALILAYEWALFVSTMFAPGSIGPNYLGIGTDWMVIHGAAKLLLQGDLSNLYDGNAFTTYINAEYGAHLFGDLDYRPWVNPPWFLLLVAPFGLLAFIPAFVASQVAQALFWGRTMYVTGSDKTGGIGKRAAVALCLLSPALAFNALCGQTAPFACALLVSVLFFAQPRPALAGVALALLSFKPQYGIAVLAFLLAAGYFRAIAWALASGIALLAVSVAVVGVQPWLDWTNLILNGLAGTGQWNDAGRLWGNSVYSCLAVSGVSPAIASAAQLVSTLGAICASVLVARRDTCRPRQIAVVMLLTLLAAPYFSGYDALLAVSALVLVYSNAPELMPKAVWSWAIPLLVWAIPFYSPPLINPAGRLTPLILIAAIVQLYAGRREETKPQQNSPKPASTTG